MISRLKHLTSASALILLTAACASTRPPLTVTSALDAVDERISSLPTSSVPDLNSPDAGSATGVTHLPRSVRSDNSNFASQLVHDAESIAVAPLRWDRSNWTRAGLAAALVGGTMLLDEAARDAVPGSSSKTTNSIADAVEPFGAEYSWGVLGAFYLSGRFLQNERAAAVARDGLTSSLIAAGAITPLLQLATGRRRPSQTEGTLITGEGGRSFPSGHTTQAFAIASVIASHYQSRWVKAGAYGLAGAVGWARMENNAHFASDVLTGALIGTIVGRTVVRLHGSERVALEASPSLDPSAPGVALTFRASSTNAIRALKGVTR